MPSLLSPDSVDAAWTVVGLCADWCDACRGYRPQFAAFAASTSEARFVWLDVEDDADWVDDIDIETFPTLLVLNRAQPVFFGPVLPRVEVIERTLASLRAQSAPRPISPAGGVAAIEALAARVSTLPAAAT